MERLEKNEVLTLSNDKEYLVYDIIEKNKNRYIYLALNTDEVEEAEVMICKEIEKEGEINLELLTDKEEIEDIANELLKGIEE